MHSAYYLHSLPISASFPIVFITTVQSGGMTGGSVCSPQFQRIRIAKHQIYRTIAADVADDRPSCSDPTHATSTTLWCAFMCYPLPYPCDMITMYHRCREQQSIIGVLQRATVLQSSVRSARSVAAAIIYRFCGVR